jgi:hypothetical protein
MNLAGNGRARPKNVISHRWFGDPIGGGRGAVTSVDIRVTITSLTYARRIPIVLVRQYPPDAPQKVLNRCLNPKR